MDKLITTPSTASSLFIGLGGNVGNVAKTFENALVLIENIIGKISQKSSLYQTEPWGLKNQDYYLNMVIKVTTSLTPGQVLEKLLEIEKNFGRIREKDNQYAPRTLDMDILFYDDKIINDDYLTIPHPKIQERNFVLIPMMEIAPDFEHPVFLKKIRALRGESTDPSGAVRI
jgi:2-amino-4-hydroxy-6-hydroxymethyldihydropteridine diphosphokinase